MKEIETKYNVTRGDLSSELNIPSEDPEVMRKYSMLSLNYKIYAPMLNEYRTEMENWQDGPLGENNSFNRNGQVYTNLERITLKNGQHAWKSNEGVFYPYWDGQIGKDEVPKELIP